MTEDDLPVVIQPGVSLEAPYVTRNSDSKFCLGSPPSEEPGEDKGFFEAGGPHGGVSASDLDQPGQACSRGKQCQDRLTHPLSEHFAREGEETRERQDSQGEFNKEKESPGLNKDETLTD